MALIAIFCDGTWNSPSQDQPTHVCRLFDATLASAEQRPVYVPGVGTGGTWSSRIGKVLDKVGGGAFGWGLNGTIKQAYRALAMVHQPGDRIAIFGFSRGAYTARSLAGMIRKVGIIDRPTEARVDEAFALYRLPGAENHPDALHILGARRRLSPRFATSQSDLDWRVAYPLTDARDSSQLLKIEYFGIWDTVGALGVPASLLGPVASLWNRKYKFHDTKLSSMVRAARHAVALDERRVFYRPSLWDNLEESREDEGLNKGDRTPQRPYQQVWFIGTHSIAGGSAGTRELTSITLDWIARGAQDAGMALGEEPPLLDKDPDPIVPCDALTEARLLYRIAGSLLDWRKGPGHPVDLHESATARVAARPDYRPLSLRALRPELFGGQQITQPVHPGGGER